VKVVQIVLAAGRSQRMGSPKPLLELGGSTLLELAWAAAAGAGVPASIVVLGDRADSIRGAHEARRLPPLPVRWVINPDPRSEQLRSLQVALEDLGDDAADAFFMHPVDHPLALADDYRRLLEAFEREPHSGAPPSDVFILSHGRRRGHPILCRNSLRAQLLALGPEASARDVIETSRICYVETPNPGVREDLDTPEAYRRAAASFPSRG